MSMDNVCHAHTRREELLYVHAYDEVEKNRSDCIYRLLRSRGREVRLNMQAVEQGGRASFAGAFGFEQRCDGGELGAEFFAGGFAL